MLPEAKTYTVDKSDVDRSKGVPSVDRFPDLSFPTLQRGKLKNGIEVVLAERHTVPITQVSLLFNAGYAADQGRKLGTASFTSALLDESTKTLDSVEVARRKERLGAIIGSGCSLDTCSVGLNALNTELTPSLALFADIVRNPAFKSDDIERVRGQWMAGIAQEKTEPTGLALRTLPPLLYGKNHAYGIPFTGSGTEKASRRSPPRISPVSSATSCVRTTCASLSPATPRWRRSCRSWMPFSVTGPHRRRAADEERRPGRRTAQAARLPDQSHRCAAIAHSRRPARAVDQGEERTRPRYRQRRLRWHLHLASQHEPARREALGLRGGQHAFRCPGPATDAVLCAGADRQDRRLRCGDPQGGRAVIGPKPLTDDEIAKIRAQKVRALPGSFETTSAVLGAMTGIVIYDRPDDYVQTLKGRIEGVDRKAAEDALTP